MRYYSTQRPVMPGGFPKKAAVEKIENFDTKTFCEEIGREAWGFIEYREPLTKEEADAYELTLGGMIIYDDESGCNSPAIFEARNESEARSKGNQYIKAWHLVGGVVTAVKEVKDE